MDLSNILNQEEEQWALKSHINWMIQGDRNMSFYHVSTLIRRKRNKILNLKNSQGEWINDLPAIMEFVRNNFLNLFTTEFTSSPLAATSNDFIYPRLLDNEF